MKMLNFSKMLIGVIVGITGALSLTLNVWGQDWYEVFTSIIFGIIVGALITDYKITIAIFKKSVLLVPKIFEALVVIFVVNRSKTFGGVAKAVMSTVIDAKSFKLSDKQKNSIHLQCLFSIFNLLLVSGFLITIFAFASIIWYLTLVTKLTPGVIYVCVSLFVFGVALLRLTANLNVSMEFTEWCRSLTNAEVKNIWDTKPGYNDFKFHLGFDYVNNKEIDFEDETIGMTFSEIFQRSFASVKTVFRKKIVKDLKGIYLFFCFIFLALISILILPLLLLKEVGNHGDIIMVSASIAVGSLCGTILHSYSLGFETGVAILGWSMVLHKIFKLNIGYFFNHKTGVYCKIKSKLGYY
ncbi:MAG: hypothetical protein ACOYMB_05540 [Patescibacteria group bacterium]